MRAYTVNYRAREREEGTTPPRGQLVNMGFFITDLPRLMPLCRLLGHRPVVDGTGPVSSEPGTHRGFRWVCCDRCGVRGAPQGCLDARRYLLRQRYRGPWAPLDVEKTEKPPTNPEGWERRPGPINPHPRGEVGGQLVLGGSRIHGVGWEVKVGNAGSEHTLAASLHLGWLGALYLHTEHFGQGLQRRLNPTGYQSRLIGVELTDGRLVWRLWSRRDHNDGEPRWMYGHLDLRVRDRLFGPKRYTYTDVPDTEVARVVRMPEGDYLVNLKLQRVTFGRRRGRKQESWSVDWNVAGRGIPTKGTDRGRILGSGVDVSARAVRIGTWAAEATAAIAMQMTRDRTQYGWEPTGPVPVEVGV